MKHKTETCEIVDTDASGGNADRLRRGVMRWLVDLGYQPLPEFTLKSGRRIDVFGLDDRGDTIAVEIKSSLADFRADRKWRSYLEFCDRFYFAVGAEFPVERLPGDTGIVIADGFGADVFCEAARGAMHTSRRRSVILRFACASAGRLYRSEQRPGELSPDRAIFG